MNQKWLCNRKSHAQIFSYGVKSDRRRAIWKMLSLISGSSNTDALGLEGRAGHGPKASVLICTRHKFSMAIADHLDSADLWEPDEREL